MQSLKKIHAWAQMQVPLYILTTLIKYVVKRVALVQV